MFCFIKFYLQRKQKWQRLLKTVTIGRGARKTHQVSFDLMYLRKSKFSVVHHELSGEGIAMKSLEERGENIRSGKFQPKISLRNAYLYKIRCDCE